MGLNILVGYECKGQRGKPECLYVGYSRSELDAVRVANTSHASFAILSNPEYADGAVRKSNPNFIPADPAAAETAEVPAEVPAEEKPKVKKK